MSIVANSNAMFDGEFPITRSLRFNSTGSQYLSRTFTVPTNTTRWTWSGWVKLGDQSSRILFSAKSGVKSQQIDISSNTIRFLGLTDGVGANLGFVTSNSLFRDFSSWYHFVCVYDGDLSGVDRAKLYCNNIILTTTLGGAFTADNIINSANIHLLGRDSYNSGANYLDGCVAEVNFIDGQALTPASFGKIHPVSGQWVAKPYTGTYGNNGFYLDFKDGTSTTTLGQDKSGNANNWTLTNFVRANGITDCWSKDTPTGNGNNFPTMNPLDKGGSLTLSNGNLSATIGAAWNIARSTFAIDKGRWYWEGTFNATSALFGITGLVSNLNTNLGVSAQDYGYQSSGHKWNNNSQVVYGTTIAVNDIVGIVFDADNRTIEFYRQGVSQGIAYTNIPVGTFYPAFSVYGGIISANFGQRAFAYPIPAGCRTLCTNNLNTPIIEKGSRHFDITLYTGNGTNQNIVNSEGFSPDLFWTKARTGAARHHALFDRNRGPNQGLYSSLASAEGNWVGQEFTSNGFKVDRTFSSETNENTIPYVAWQWKASGTTPVYNNKGTLPSFVNVNKRAGFSVVTFETHNSTGGTVGHGLPTAPKLIIVKGRNAGAQPQVWFVYHKSVGATAFLDLVSTNGQAVNATYMNNTEPTSDVFTMGSGQTQANYGLNQVAYCFSEVEGYSKIGSYIGNGSADGTFVYTGFRPRWFLVKNTSSATDWYIHDTARDVINPANKELYPNTTDIEIASSRLFDILSNGFKVRDTNAGINSSGGTYIYYAIAETPFQYSNAR